MVPPRPVRRILLPVLLAVEVGLFVALAAASVPAAVLAAVDRRRRALRLVALGMSYLGLEVCGIVAFGATWVLRPVRPAGWYDDANERVIRWVLERLLLAARRWVGFSVVLDEIEAPGPLDGTEPVLVLARHGGIGDSFTLAWLVLTRFRRRPKVVLKSALRWEPLVDVALTRLGACFVVPRAPDNAARMAALAASLEAREAVLLFPEGGNWTPRRRRRTIEWLRAHRRYRDARAATLMAHVLTPKFTGVLACLDARPRLPVVVVAHAGLDKLTTVSAVWRALPFTTPMVLRWWPAPPPPDAEDARRAWLTTEWAVVDEWVDARTSRVAPLDNSFPI